MKDKRIACVFTGQGAQHPGMGEKLQTFEPYTSCIETFEATSSLPLREWLFESDKAALQQTQVAQPLIFTYSFVAYQAFVRTHTPNGWFYAGHSLGEYTALAAAGCLNPKKTVGVVHMRGKLMQEVCPNEFGGMAAVFTRDVDDVMTACETISQKFGDERALVVANFNSERQVVVSGRLACLRQLYDLGSEVGIQKVVPLDVSAPFHSPYMTSMKESFAEVCEEAIYNPFICEDLEGCYLPNVTAEPMPLQEVTPDLVLKLLLAQLDHPVRWSLIVRALSRVAGLDAIVEFGPKPVLSTMMKRDVQVPVFTVSDQASLETVNVALQG